MRFAVAYFVVGIIVLFIPLWSWRFTYRIYRHFSSSYQIFGYLCYAWCGQHFLTAFLSDRTTPALQRRRFIAEGINFDEDTDKSDDFSLHNSGTLVDPEEDEETCQNMMKVMWRLPLAVGFN